MHLEKILTKYIQLKKLQEKEVKRIKKNSLRFSILRLITAIVFAACLYYYFYTNHFLLLLGSGISAIAFFAQIKWHEKISFRLKVKKALVQINEAEIDFLENKDISFDNGIEYLDTTHPFSYDLDIFGDNSLFQSLNRTATYIGKKTLANSLLSPLQNEEIELNQEAIKELSKDIEWRQDIFSISKITEDSESIYAQLLKWTTSPNQTISNFLTTISFVFPGIYFISLGGMFFTEFSAFSNIALMTFLINLFIVFTQYKKIKTELIDATKIKDILRNYSLILQQIESKTFSSKKLNHLKDTLHNEASIASNQIKKLSSIFGQLENILNPIGSGFLNGTLLYHIHTLRNLYHWKSVNKTKIINWLEIIGEFEKLNSFANLSFNNPEFSFPSLNSNHIIKFKDLSHPLLNRETRINNSIDFNPQSFIILTGSNMSGKSTFLRSLGINMVLAGIGSPICARSANIHPLNVLVSMRLSDSLNDNESYFFAEVKRLKKIMEQAKERVSFVLLDEILRGTNSNDKRTGTVEVIKKMIQNKVYGAIATHDLKVCDTTNEFPNILTNKCFEVEIIKNELVFDYKIKDGVCKNKSATFLMKKMEII